MKRLAACSFLSQHMGKTVANISGGVSPVFSFLLIPAVSKRPRTAGRNVGAWAQMQILTPGVFSGPQRSAALFDGTRVVGKELECEIGRGKVAKWVRPGQPAEEVQL